MIFMATQLMERNKHSTLQNSPTMNHIISSLQIILQYPSQRWLKLPRNRESILTRLWVKRLPPIQSWLTAHSRFQDSPKRLPEKPIVIKRISTSNDFFSRLYVGNGHEPSGSLVQRGGQRTPPRKRFQNERKK